MSNYAIAYLITTYAFSSTQTLFSWILIALLFLYNFLIGRYSTLHITWQNADIYKSWSGLTLERVFLLLGYLHAYYTLFIPVFQKTVTALASFSFDLTVSSADGNVQTKIYVHTR